MSTRDFPDAVAEAVNAVVEEQAAQVEAIMARVFADVGDECRSVRIGDTVWTTHSLAPASALESLRLRALGCSCARQAESWREGL